MMARAYDACIDGIYYNFSGDAAEVTYKRYQSSSPFYISDYSGDIVIPESVTYSGKSYSVKSVGDGAFYKCSGLISCTIPDCVTSIRKDAFSGCSSLSSITIGNGVTNIGESAFAACSSLTFVNLPDCLTTIGDNAFGHCSALNSITIPNSVASIGYSAFHDCDNLTSVTIPNSVTSIGSYAFYNCTSLTSITIPNSVISIGDWTFVGCTSLTSVTIPESVTSIGSSAFAACSSLTSITIGNGVTSIGGSAFSGCTSLTSITIGNGVTSIGEWAFRNCNSLKDFYCYSKEIPQTGTGIFTGSPYTTAKLYVPRSSLSSYEARSPWGSFGEILPITNTITYIVDGEVYKSYEVEYSATIIPEPEPTKEGCTFSGWSEIPETMPTHDVTVTGSFIPNNYSLTYIVDGEVYKTYTVTYGTSIAPEPVPTKEGYTFSGWSYIPATMPATDVVVMGTFTINKYTLTYKVDGEVYKNYTVEYGAVITPEPEPTKEGYTFSGWSTIPTTMPARNVTVTGTFTPINYTLTYKVDGQVYKTYTVAYGSTITPEPAPTKEGYSFSGWSGLPTTMPAHDVTVTGTFTINSYTLTYEVDGQVYKTYTVEYDAAIIPEPEPIKEGYTFSGWSEIPETMPAHNVTVTGTFTKIIIKCATPTISYANGKLTFTCETEGAICHSTITDTDIKSYSGNEVDLTVTYYISVYASKEDYEDSEVATGTLCWIDQQPSTEGIVNEDAVTEVKALPILIQSNRGTITVQGANEGTEVSVFSVNGMKLGSAIATQGLATISTSLQSGSTAIVKIGEKAIKVLIK